MEQSLNQISPFKWRFISYDACSFFGELTNCYSTLYVTVVYENVVQIILLIPMDFCNNLHTFRDYLASPVVSLTAEQVSCCLHEDHQPFLPTSNIYKLYPPKNIWHQWVSFSSGEYNLPTQNMLTAHCAKPCLQPSSKTLIWWNTIIQFVDTCYIENRG